MIRQSGDEATDEGIGDVEKEDEEEDEETVLVNETQAAEEVPAEEELTPEMEDDIETRKRNMCQQDDWIIDYEFDFKDNLSCRLELSVHIQFSLYLINFDFTHGIWIWQVPLSTKKVDMSSAIRRWAESAVVHQVPQIRRAIVDPPKTEEEDVFVKTDGVNIVAMFEHSKILDLNRLYCNNIHSVYNQYGIEAASSVIVKVISFHY